MNRSWLGKLQGGTSDGLFMVDGLAAHASVSFIIRVSCAITVCLHSPISFICWLGHWDALCVSVCHAILVVVWFVVVDVSASC